ncbi:MAG: glycyl-radical enzyme activating protein [Bacteroidia bacterium]|nr:MAG: glycyl-radical enzyme activating protein [Bacteroidia bacterium]
MIFNIQRFSTHDGDGIRTLIFYKGCPLRCQWCSNPESHSFGYSIMYDQTLCKRFGDCTLAEPAAFELNDGKGVDIRRREVNQPLNLKDVCASKALVLTGDDLSVDDLMTEIEKDVPFYKDDGGVTLSGGEPLSQDQDLILLLKRLKERKISTSMETSLHVSWARIERCIGMVGTFLVDLKHTDKEKFRHYILGDAGLVMRNLEKLAYFGAKVVVRIPVIPGFNHSLPEIQQMVDKVSTISGIEEIHFLPYHTFGVEKYKMLGMEYEFGTDKQVHESELELYVQYAQSRGFRTKIGG